MYMKTCNINNFGSENKPPILIPLRTKKEPIIANLILINLIN